MEAGRIVITVSVISQIRFLFEMVCRCELAWEGIAAEVRPASHPPTIHGNKQMSKKIKRLKVFIASPDGLTKERKAFRDVIAEFSESTANIWNIDFQPFEGGDTLSDAGRPQELINEDIRKCDYFILLLHSRWGSSPDNDSSKYTSGTEEEYSVALECYNDSDLPMRKLIMVFKGVASEQMSDPGEQLQKVIDFREKIEAEKKHLYVTFDTTKSFGKLIHKYLGQWLHYEVNGTADQVEPLSDAGLQVEGKLESIPQDEAAQSANMALADKAWELAEEGKLTEAEVEFAKASVGQNQPGPIISFGVFLDRIGRLDQAIAMYEKAAGIAEDQRNQIAAAAAYGNLGNVFQTRGEVARAEEMYRKAIEINELLDRKEGMANQYGNLGVILGKRRDLDEAEKMFKKALDIDEELDRKEGMANQYGNLGLVLKYHGDLDGAEDMHRKSLEIHEELGILVGIARDYTNLGNVFYIRGDLDGAEEMHRKSLEIHEKLGILVGMARDYANLGNVFYIRGDLEGAEQMYRKALDICEQLGFLEGMANCYGNLGALFGTRGDLDGAEEMNRKALDINEQLGHLEGMANCYGNLGTLFGTRGDLDGAEEMHRKALEINERLGLLEGMASDYANLGNVLADRGDLDGAEELYRKGLGYAEQLGSTPKIEHINSLLDGLREAPAAD